LDRKFELNGRLPGSDDGPSHRNRLSIAGLDRWQELDALVCTEHALAGSYCTAMRMVSAWTQRAALIF
jgi:hypothetical protein